MIRVVIDTNVVVSAALSDEGNPAGVLDLAMTSHIAMLVSAEILAEYEGVLRRPRFKLLETRVRKMLGRIRMGAMLGATSSTNSRGVMIWCSCDAQENAGCCL
jgi:putative PIN family toxin of toxin-antitoxin system